MRIFSIDTVASKQAILIKITVSAWLIAKFMSWKLWLSDRIFPTISLTDWLVFPNEVHIILLILSLFGLTALFFYPRNFRFMGLFFIVELMGCALDQMRWQPWEYQYLLTIFFALIFRKDPRKFISCLLLLIGTTYIFSGVHKFNGGFLYSIWDKMILNNFFGFSNDFIKIPIVHYSGLLLAFFEIAIGVALLFLKNKKYVIRLAVIMHLLLLLILGPLGLNKNSIVWPWNVAMLLYVLLMFDKSLFSNILSLTKTKLGIFAAAVIILLPATNFIGVFPNYLSYRLYSGNNQHLYLKVNEIPEELNFIPKRQINADDNRYWISVSTWSLQVLNVPMYPEESAFIKFKKAWDKKFPNCETTFLIYAYPFQKENIKEIP